MEYGGVCELEEIVGWGVYVMRLRINLLCVLSILKLSLLPDSVHVHASARVSALPFAGEAVKTKEQASTHS